MKNKWVRVNDDSFVYAHFGKGTYGIWNRGPIKKTADIPQGLVQIKDLVDIELYEDINLTRVVINVIGGVFYIDNGEMFVVEDITKIRTPNSDGDYIKQWEKIKWEGIK